MSLYERHTYDDEQILFNRILSAFTIAIKVVLKLLVYSPLLFLSFIITKQILDVTTDKILWVALILLFAGVLYFIIYFFKGVLIALIHNRNLFWIPVFICLLSLTCILPVWIIFDPLKNFITSYTETNNEILTWIFAGAFGLYVYSKYHFLTNIAPTIAYPYYQRGINVAMHLINPSRSFKAKKSQEIF